MAAGLLLTGGTSRRMGTDKALIEVAGERLADRAARVLGAVCSPVLEVGPGHSDLDAVREDPPGEGPLAAIAAGGTALRCSGHRGPAIVLAVDMPLVTEELLRFLEGWPGEATVVPFVGGEPQPVCARYSGEALLRADEAVRAGERSTRVPADPPRRPVGGSPDVGKRNRRAGLRRPRQPRGPQAPGPRRVARRGRGTIGPGCSEPILPSAAPSPALG
jgi:molybdopterin-guanine dinucleotide biosynthesis protein A